MEMSNKRPLRRGHRGNNATRPPSLGLDNAGVDNFYDSVKEGMSRSQNSSIYNIPEADYSLITTLSKVRFPNLNLHRYKRTTQEH